MVKSRPYSPLQRLSHALGGAGRRIRGTDWWAALIELAIVVFGILIAFQLDAWGERRAQERAERTLWQRLAEEAQSDARALRAIERQHLDSASNYALLAEAVRDPRREADYRQRGSAGCNLLRMPAVRRQSAGALGQAAGARLDLISDPELRRRLRMAEAQRAFSDRQLDYFRGAFMQYGEVIDPYTLFAFAPNGQVSCRVDIAALRGDRRAVALLPKLYRDHRRFAEYRRQEITSLERVSQRIACLASGRCKRGD